MIPKEYLDNYAVRGLDQRQFIIITYNENTFSANNRCRKV